MLSWIVTDVKETFDLKINNNSLNALKYLDSGFQLSDNKVSLFQSDTRINEVDVTDQSEPFEYLPGVLTHKILEKVADVVPVTKIELNSASLDTGVLNETISSFCQLNIPKAGLHTLKFDFFKPPLKERLSESVLD